MSLNCLVPRKTVQMCSSKRYKHIYKTQTLQTDRETNIQARFLLGCIGWHELRGSPVKPWKHIQEGAWLITRHSAFKPHVPGHGSLHLLFIHALDRSHSELRTHSGLHPVYGSPKKSFMQIQDPAPFLSLHKALVPHGDGLHGSRGPSRTTGSTAAKFETCRLQNIIEIGQVSIMYSKC